MPQLQEFQRARTRLKNKLALIDYQLNNVLKDRQLKNSRDVIELQIERLSYLDLLRFFRPTDKQDIDYRESIFNTFPEWVKENISDETHLVFHGTTLANAERILNSGRITSGKDRWTIHTSGDNAGEFSISTKDFLEISMHHHMDLIETYREYEPFVPAGCLFVLKINPSEYSLAKDQQRIHNLNFKKNPKQLYAVITTPENISRVKWWMQKNNFSPSKVIDFKGFQEKIINDNIFFSLTNYSYQK